MVTKQEAMFSKRFEHTTLKNADNTPLRARANGRCQTWRTRPEEFKLPIKHGLRDTGYLTNVNAANWVVAK